MHGFICYETWCPISLYINIFRHVTIYCKNSRVLPWCLFCICFVSHNQFSTRAQCTSENRTTTNCSFSKMTMFLYKIVHIYNICLHCRTFRHCNKILLIYKEWCKIKFKIRFLRAALWTLRLLRSNRMFSHKTCSNYSAYIPLHI